MTINWAMRQFFIEERIAARARRTGKALPENQEWSEREVRAREWERHREWELRR